ncbi:MAG: thiamine phosphate synthase [Bacteroidetes bacterium]|nr:thiamine phosphate synthase [Bacteroidota bacterium]MBU1720450.1 thiamine phosphate synthase [Bacteroidota bacterium]
MESNKYISKFHFITSGENLGDYFSQIEDVCRAGADWIQLRVKDAPFDKWLDIAEKSKHLCDAFGARLIINDSVEIAQRVQAYGVHLGKNDMNPSEARHILGREYVIGATANLLDEILHLPLSDIDYIGLGPFRFTDTKKNLSPVLGLAAMADIVAQCHKRNIRLPIVAIGGISASDCTDLLENNLHGVAVSSVISKTTDRIKVTKEFLTILKLNNESIDNCRQNI